MVSGIGRRCQQPDIPASTTRREEANGELGQGVPQCIFHGATGAALSRDGDREEAS